MVKVSVIIPCYNAEKYILEAIDSILNQSYENIEIIVVDDCSTDKSLSLLSSIKSDKLKILQLERNSGYANALIKGIDIAIGDYIARMDADDISVKTRIEKQVKVLNDFHDIAFVSSNRFRILPSGKGYMTNTKYNEELVVQTWDNLIENKRIFVDAGTMFSKDKYLSVGGYRNYQRSGMDVDLWLRLLEKYKPALAFTSPLYGHRLLPESIIFSKNTNNINQIPRRLSVLRKEKGIAIGEDLKFIDTIKIANQELAVSNESINIGMAALCLVFKDFKGAVAFFRCGFEISNKNFVVVFIVLLKKYFQKLRNLEVVAFKY
jgi:glycosyltransferase involved in cell wall biosynthesis